MDRNAQQAPWPSDLERAVADLRYKPGYQFRLAHVDRDFADEDRSVVLSSGLTFIILVPCQDSYHPERYRPVTHYHPVPAATYNRGAWERWLLDRVLETETHEACEYFRFGDDDATARRPFAPTHGPGDNPYVVNQYATDEQRRTSFRGVTKR